ncbi:hypothetical protein [Nitrosococcus oceani]|uniref:hypothetical protein n=1 Tax=Nitrosococcus oceani TaxID=1229 RepID=UPI0012E0B2F1|nr:hypothetical protein [Nitrosococcus oceani]
MRQSIFIALGIAFLPEGKRRNALALSAEVMFTQDFAGAILPFDEGAAVHYAALVAHRTRIGRPISTEDTQIAAITLSHGLFWQPTISGISRTSRE